MPKRKTLTKIEQFKQDPIISDWIDTLNPSPNTESNYLIALKAFSEWTKKSPKELIEEAEAEIKTGLLMRQRTIKKDMIGFRKYLQDEKKFAPMTIKGYISGIKSFYKTFDIDTPELPRIGKAKPLKENYDIPNKEDIQHTLKTCDPLEKALILTGVSSGLASNEIANLKVGDYKKGFDKSTGITTLFVRRLKVDWDFVTFLSPEASRAVQDYLDYREREVKVDCTRRSKQREKQKIFSDDDYLFIGRKIPDSFLTTRDENERKLERIALMRIFRVISEKARKSTPKSKWNLIRSHNMRKLFNSALLNAGADSFFVEYLMGHTLDETRGAYFRAQPEKLKEIYKRYIPYLTIQKELDISESPEYQQIKKEKEILQAETARHVIERSELQDLRNELEEMKKKKKEESEVMNIIMELMRQNPDFEKDTLKKE